MATSGHHPVSSESGADVDVLVVGAGPTGLVAASESLRRGLSVRIIERRASRGTFSKALVVHARTLEVFDTMGVAQSILRVGAPCSALNANFAGSRGGFVSTCWACHGGHRLPVLVVRSPVRHRTGP